MIFFNETCSMRPCEEAVAAYEELARLLEAPAEREKATAPIWNNMGTILGTYGSSTWLKDMNLI